jgi:site-specific recombinase XerD
MKTTATELPTALRRSSITEYLPHLASRGLSGMHRARVLAAIRAYCTFLFTAELNGAAFG